MNDTAHDQTGRRRYLARAGITALNLIAPGLGLLRVGNWRAAVPFLLAPLAMIALITFGMGHLPITSYSGAVLALAAIISLLAALYAVSAVLTWRESRFRSSPRGWSRWYGLAAVVIVMTALSQLAAPMMHRFYKPFYAPSESMAPTIGKGDKFIADMRWRGPFRRGEIIIFNGPGGIRVSRIAAVPGDRIALHGGVPVLNGHAALQSSDGRTSFISNDGLQSATMLTELLPGATAAHRVLDSGPSELDEMPEVLVAADHLFVLGDNRDNSADSRVPPEFAGVGLVSFSSVVGRPMYIHWSSDHAKIGVRLDR